jgi:hypothetical protein
MGAPGCSDTGVIDGVGAVGALGSFMLGGLGGCGPGGTACALPMCAMTTRATIPTTATIAAHSLSFILGSQPRVVDGI